MATNTKLVTVSLTPETVKKLEGLTKMMATPNKSRVITLLIEKEYMRRIAIQEELNA